MGAAWGSSGVEEEWGREGGLLYTFERTVGVVVMVVGVMAGC